jgi:hypothetical protein
MKLLYVIGGLLFGDTFQCIPYLNKYRNEGFDEITWVTGSFSKEASSYIASCPYYRIKKLIYIPDGSPCGFNDRIIFQHRYKVIRNMINVNKYDKELCDPRLTFEWDYQAKDSLIPYLDFKTGPSSTKRNYICVQYASRHADKITPVLKDVKFPLPVKSLGLKGEEIIEGTEDCTGIPFCEVVNIILGCRIFVGINSSLAVLSFYLNKPTIICCSIKGLFPFNKYKKQCIDIITQDPIEIEAKINHLINCNY